MIVLLSSGCFSSFEVECSLLQELSFSWHPYSWSGEGGGVERGGWSGEGGRGGQFLLCIK